MLYQVCTEHQAFIYYDPNFIQLTFQSLPPLLTFICTLGANSQRQLTCQFTCFGVWYETGAPREKNMFLLFNDSAKMHFKTIKDLIAFSKIQILPVTVYNPYKLSSVAFNCTVIHCNSTYIFWPIVQTQCIFGNIFFAFGF